MDYALRIGHSGPPTFEPGNVFIVLAGQSNAHGVGLINDVNETPLDVDAELWAFAQNSFERVFIWTGNVFVNLELGINNGGLNPPPGSGTRFGPEFGLAVRWMRETAEGNLYLMKLGTSGASITAYEPNAGFNSYSVLRDDINQAEVAFTSGSITIASRAFIWVQGETDRLETQSWYQTRLEEMLTEAYADEWFSNTSPQILFQMATESTLYGAGVAAAKVAVAANAPDYIKTTPSPNYFEPDNYHQNARGQVQMGYNAFSLIFNRATIEV